MTRWIVALALAGFAGSALAQTPEKATAIIRGRIVAADTGAPLRRARITAASPALNSPPRGTTTNADGRYELKDLPEGRYTITVARSGYLPLRYGQRRPLEQATPLQVLEGQMLERVDFALPRTGRITGLVLDEVGDPVAGVQVFAMRLEYWQGSRRLVPAAAAARTDDSGAYKLVGLAPGAYVVRAGTRETWTVTRAGHRETMLFAPTFFPGTSSAATAQRVSVGIGQNVAGNDFALIAVRAATVSGRAVDSRGAPVANVALMLDTAGPNGGTVGMAGSAVRNADGSFTIRDVAPGDYKLVAAGNSEMATLTLTVTAEDIENVSMITSAGWSVAGTLATESGEPPSIPRERIRIATPLLAAASGMMLQGQPRGRSVINEDWTFLVTAIVGAARMRVTLPDGWAVKSILKDDRDIADAPLELKSGEEMSGVRIIITDRITTIAGQLADDKGAPISDGTVVVFASDRRKWGEDSRFVRAARPDPQGQWQIKGLPPGDYLAVAIDYVQEGMWNDPDYLESVRRYGQKLTLSETGSQSMSLKLVTVQSR